MKDMIMVGIDSSKRCTGVSVLKHYKHEDQDKFEILDKWLIKTKNTPTEALFESELTSYNLMVSTMKPYIKKVNYAAFEGFAFGGQGLTQLSSTAAVFQLYYAQQKKPIVHIAPTRVKLIVAGSGRADKIEVRAGLSKFIDNFDTIVWKSYDESDSVAIAIASAIINLYPERFPVKVKTRKVIKKVEV